MREDDCGPLQSVFPCPESRVLDHMLIMEDFDYSASEISEITGVEPETVRGIAHDMEKQGLFVRTGKVKSPDRYQFNIGSVQGKSLRKLAFDIAKQRISKTLETVAK